MKTFLASSMSDPKLLVVFKISTLTAKTNAHDVLPIYHEKFGHINWNNIYFI